MTTHRLYFAGGLVPKDTGGGAYWKNSLQDDTNDLHPHPVLAFQDSGNKDGATASIPIPKNYVGTAKVGIRWKSTGTTGNAYLTVDYNSIAAGESADPSSYQESLNVTTATPGTARQYVDSEVTLTASNLAADDTLQITISRDSSNAADTLTSLEVLVEEVWLEYADA